ncbi:hypothetical protein sscle_09g069440 [Sclerotinia sclerotiorum 1980 UF-70]|uniref:Concanavalin A-like lectin/glucanase n=1 Tax=Sclerotinia sclerotiorum (strain ATCC 18683 / 1980 / Ss-1) TaxID=665079 RepID=A0A1D9QB31_SCLS1|nr:hypothetical protein sscle_09g069440 [Sclerotinia sclerotiorum 1980 UF-70]
MLLNLQSKIIIAFLTSSIHAQKTQICDPTVNATTNSGRYTFFSDVVTTDNSEYQCTDFTLADDTSTNTTQFTTTFSWSEKDTNTSTPHSFPSLSLNLPSVLPIPISNISLFPLTNNWALYPGNPIPSITSTSISSLKNASVTASCYLNIYLDLNSSLSQTPSFAATKISIWQANYGGVVPEGYYSNRATISRPVIDLAGIAYTLYTFQNTPLSSSSSPSLPLSSSSSLSNTTTQTHTSALPLVPQTIYTWYPNTNVTTLTAMDISPLLNFLWREVYLSSETYVGFVEWGLEMRESKENVSWDVYDVGMDVRRGTPVKAVGTGAAGREREVGRGEMLALVGLVVGGVVLFG